jgi:hypothetical protein
MIKYTNCKNKDGQLYFDSYLRNEIKLTYHTIPDKDYTLKSSLNLTDKNKYECLIFAEDLYTIIPFYQNTSFKSIGLVTSITITFLLNKQPIETPDFHLIHQDRERDKDEKTVADATFCLKSAEELLPIDITQLMNKHVYIQLDLKIDDVSADKTVITVLDGDHLPFNTNGGLSFFQYKNIYVAILRDNHNARNNLELIRQLLEALKPSKFSFLPSSDSRLDPFNTINLLTGLYTENDITHFSKLNVDLPPLLLSSVQPAHREFQKEFQRHREFQRTLQQVPYSHTHPWYDIIINKMCMHKSRYKVALLLQIANIALFDEMIYIILNFRDALNGDGLLVMVNIPEDVDLIIEKLSDIGLSDYVVTSGENRGMDLGGFMIQTDFLLKHARNNGLCIEWVFKFHTKTDDKWRRSMIEELAGNLETIRTNINTEASVIIPKSHLHDARKDNHNKRILDWYRQQYDWKTPESFSAGTMFGIRWNVLLQFWEQSIHTPEQTFNLFKNHYFPNTARESFAHAWERILSGYLPYNHVHGIHIHNARDDHVHHIHHARDVDHVHHVHNADDVIHRATIQKEKPIPIQNEINIMKILTKLYNGEKLTYKSLLKEELSLPMTDWIPAKNEVDVIIHETSYTLNNEHEGLNILKISWSSYLMFQRQQLSQYTLILAEDEYIYRHLLNKGFTQVFLLNNVLPCLHHLLFNNLIQESNEIVIVRVYCDGINNPKSISSWGDYIMAKNLKWILTNKLGMNVIIDTLFDDREYPAQKYFYLAGYDKFKVDSTKTNYLWIYSHPSQWLNRASLLQSFSKIFVASESFIPIIKEQIPHSVHYLPQVFVHAREENLINKILDKILTKKDSYNISFIGNSRNVYRQCVKTVLDNGNKLNIWGRGWKTIIPSSYREKVSIKWIENCDLWKILQSSRIIVNDHWPDMRDGGFISMKTYEFMANKAFFITDNVAGMDQHIVTYQSSEELANNITYYLEHEEERNEIVQKLYEVYRKSYDKAIATLSQAFSSNKI